MGVTARLVTADGWPAADAMLTAIDTSGRQSGRSPAAPDGSVQLPDLAAGQYTLVATAPGLAPAARTVSVNGAPVSLGDIPLASATGLRLPEPGEWTVDPVHSAIRVTARHLGLSSVHGRFTDFTGRVLVASPPERTRVEAVIAAASVDTGNETRDTHLRTADFLAVDEYPEITFGSVVVARQDAAGWTMDGDLTLRGVTKPVRLDVRYLGTGPDQFGGVRCAFTASTSLRRDEFAVNWNQAVRIGVGVVDATLRVELDIQAVRS